MKIIGYQVIRNIRYFLKFQVNPTFWSNRGLPYKMEIPRVGIRSANVCLDQQLVGDAEVNVLEVLERKYGDSLNLATTAAIARIGTSLPRTPAR